MSFSVKPHHYLPIHSNKHGYLLAQTLLQKSVDPIVNDTCAQSCMICVCYTFGEHGHQSGLLSL